MNDQERLQRVLDWFEQIKAEAVRLAADHYIFRETKNLVAKNPRLENAPGEFFRWMEDNFIIAAGAAVRRQADGREDVISLRRLLKGTS